MKLTFFVNYLNHHQMPLAEELYQMLGDDFHFVATYPRNINELKGGKDFSLRPYCLLPSESDEHYKIAKELNITSDVCIFGSGNLDWERDRAKTNKLSFEISERWFKRGWLNLFSPRLLSWWWLYQTTLRSRRFYKLCASAYTASDNKRLMTFKNRCYKWGYFTQSVNPKVLKPTNKDARIMWCGKLISWKHPEYAIIVADRLKKDGYDFSLEIYGDGVLKYDLEQMIEKASLGAHVTLMGNVPNDEILAVMKSSDIFLFTSDKQEGWGAVVNEAMSNGCCVVGSNAAGSVPYLIDSGRNGMIYNDGDIDSIYQAVRYLLEYPKRCRIMGEAAAEDLHKKWSPRVAANNLLLLIDTLLVNDETPIKEGPCSKA